MANEWFYAQAGQREGPVSFDDLKQLIQQGQLLPTDHVWKQGTATWVPASNVEGLFGTEPPPLPPPSPSPPTRTNATTSTSVYTKEGLAAWMKWLDSNKIIICVVSAVVGISLAFVSRSITRNDSIRTLFAVIGILPACTFGIIWAVNRQKREMLHGLWEPISGDGVYFQFTKDGALVRGDDVATRYRWLTNDRIELYTDDASPKVQIEILSLSKLELIVRADGQGGHFKKGVTVTEQASREAWAKVGAIAGGAAMLALGGLAILGKAAVGTMTDAILDPALGTSPTGIGGSFSGGGTSSPSPASGPPATPANTTQQTQQSPPRLRVAALCGAIIVDDDGTLVTYKKKCESCGHVDPGTTRMQIRRGVTSGSFPCTKCGKMQETKIQGT